MHRIGNLREAFLSFSNLYTAWKKAFRSTKTAESYEYSFHLERNLFALQEDLRSGLYTPGDYRYFTITDPKVRIISVAPFRDRIVHHALVNILEPIYEKCFFFHSYATRKNKGTHKAIRQAQAYLRKNRWYLKMDIAKYFDSIDHNILFDLLSKKIKDELILSVCGKIMDKGGDGKRGLPIGNLTSQFWANVYLNRFDHFLKDELAVPYYVRYMDDFVIFSNENAGLLKLRQVMEEYLLTNLKLRLKPSATMLNSRLHGLPFLGVRIFPSTIRIKRENFERSFARLKLRGKEYKQGAIDYKRYSASMMSLISHLTCWNSRELVKKELLNVL